MRMRGLIPLMLAAVFISGAAHPAATPGEDIVAEDFAMQPDTRWRFFTDQVMGGVSTGELIFAREGDLPYARMAGRVSTANRGGFIQMRLELTAPPPAGTIGVRLRVRGNAQRYFVHLRTSGTRMPWQYHQAGFDAVEAWGDIRLPLDAFAASGGLAPGAPRAGSLTSIAIAAYGRDHDALIEVAEVGFY
jgi:hypothetical protein